MKGKRRGAGYFLQKHTTFAPLDFWRMHSKAKFSLLCTIFLIFSQMWLQVHITILSIDKYKRICKISTPLVFINWVQYIHESNIIFHFAIKCYKLKNGKNFYYLYLVGIYGDQVQKRQLREMTITGDQNCYSLDPLILGTFLFFFWKQNLIFHMTHVHWGRRPIVYCNLV